MQNTTSSGTPSLGITWQRPTFLLPLFCLCPLLGSTNSLTEALSMALLVALLTLLGNLLVYVCSRLLPTMTSPALWLICAATLITLVELALHASFYQVYRQLGIFLPMAVIACLLLARSEMQMQQRSLWASLQRSGLMSAGYMLAAAVLGAGRELVGHGSVFTDAAQLWGNWAKPLEQQVFRADMGFLLAILAPGAFVALGLGVALYNWLWLQLQARRQSA